MGGTGIAFPGNDYSSGCPKRTSYTIGTPYMPTGFYRGGSHSCKVVTMPASPGTAAGYEKCDVAWKDSPTGFAGWVCSADDGANPRHCTSWKAFGPTYDDETGSALTLRSLIVTDSLKAGGLSTLSQSVVVKGADGNNCNLVFNKGLLTGTSCP